MPTPERENFTIVEDRENGERSMHSNFNKAQPKALIGIITSLVMSKRPIEIFLEEDGKTSTISYEELQRAKAFFNEDIYLIPGYLSFKDRYVRDLAHRLQKAEKVIVKELAQKFIPYEAKIIPANKDKQTKYPIAFIRTK